MRGQPSPSEASLDGQRGLAGPGHNMGQSFSLGNGPETKNMGRIASKTLAMGSAAASSTGSKVKRALNVRRKKTTAPGELEGFTASQPTQSKKPLDLHIPQSSMSSSSSPSGNPPPTPPKLHIPARQSSMPQPSSAQRNSVMTISPGMSHAVHYMSQGESPQEQRLPSTEEHHEQKENWRKSDSDKSHHTIRPTVGTRTPRPSSIVATLPEDDDASFSSSSHASAHETSYTSGYPSHPSHPSHPPSHETSYSSSYPSHPPAPIPSPSPSAELRQPPLHPSNTRENPALSRTAANGIISPSSTGFQSTGNNIRGRLAAWSATTKPGSSSNGMPRPPLHPQRQGSPSLPSMGPQNPSSSGNRSTSGANGSTPAGGFAKRAMEKMGRAWGDINPGAGSGYSSSDSSNAPSSFNGGAMLHQTESETSLSGSGKPKKHGRTPNAPSGAWSIASSMTGGASSSESDIPIGPYLGDMVRPPLQPEGGLVFGRPLKNVTRNTPIVPIPHSRGSTDSRASSDDESIRAISRRCLPAVAARCAQHIIIWGIQEEGLFRVNGRPSHVTKVRSDFDTGADFNMARCSPGELDPHAVSGVFKAFLRELPEPLLTHALMPHFDAAMSKESSTHDSASSPHRGVGSRGPGLPSGPRGGMQQLNKPPSLTTLAMPNLHGMRAASPELVKTLQSLISRLPQENRDLLKTVVDVVKVTASASKVTKMPLSNLILVFCPTLHMSPPLLRALSEADGLWGDTAVSRGTERPSTKPVSTPSPVVAPAPRSPPIPPSAPVPVASVPVPQHSPTDSDDEVLDIRRQTLVLDIKAATDSQSGDDRTTETPSTSKPLLSMAPKTLTTSSQSSPEEAASPTSPSSLIVGRGFNVPRPMGPRKASSSISITRPATSGVALGTLISSTEFPVSSPLASPEEEHPKDASSPPSSSAESLLTPSTSNGPSISRPAEQEEPFTKHSAPSAPIIMLPIIDSPVRENPRRPAISGPIGPPIHFPSMSLPGSPLSANKRSFSSSLPLSSGQISPSSPNGSMSRLKRPSLHLLFSKRSNPSLASSGRPIISNPIPLSASSDGFPSPTPSTSTPPTLPPMVDSAMEPFGFGMDLDFSSKSPTTDSHPSLETQRLTPDLPVRATTPTPIADLYRFAGSSSASLASSSSIDHDDKHASEPPSPPPVTHLRLKPGRQVHAEPAQVAAQNSNESALSAPSHSIDEEEYDDDWTTTVLLAADVDWRAIPTQ